MWQPATDSRQGRVAFCPLINFYMRVVLADGCDVRRSADPVCNQLANKKWPSHLAHRRPSDFSARLFRQGDAKQIEEARHEYLNASGFGCLAVLNDGYEGAGAQYRQ